MFTFEDHMAQGPVAIKEVVTVSNNFHLMMLCELKQCINKICCICLISMERAVKVWDYAIITSEFKSH